MPVQSRSPATKQTRQTRAPVLQKSLAAGWPSTVVISEADWATALSGQCRILGLFISVALPNGTGQAVVPVKYRGCFIPLQNKSKVDVGHPYLHMAARAGRLSELDGTPRWYDISRDTGPAFAWSTIGLSAANLVEGPLICTSRSQSTPILQQVWFAYVAARNHPNEVRRFPLRDRGHIMPVKKPAGSAIQRPWSSRKDLVSPVQGKVMCAEPDNPSKPTQFSLLRLIKLTRANLRPTAKKEQGYTFTVWSLWIPDDTVRTGRRSFEIIWNNNQILTTRDKSREELEKGNFFASAGSTSQPDYYILYCLPK